MNVAFDISSLHPLKGGVYSYTHYLLAHLAAMPDRVDITVVDGLGRRGWDEVLRDNNCNVPECRYVVAKQLPSLCPGRDPWQQRGLHHLRAALDRQFVLPFWQTARTRESVARCLMPRDALRRIDVAHWSEETFVKLPRVRHVVTIHDAIPLLHPEWLRPERADHHRRKLKIFARYADRIVVDSRATFWDVRETLMVPEDRIDIVPLAAGPEFFMAPNLKAETEVLKKYGLRKGAYVLYVGTIEPRKNLVRLASAFRIAIEHAPCPDVQLVLAGRLGWLTRPIQAGIAGQHLGDRLVQLSWIPPTDLPHLLRGARIFAYVSLYEGFGLPPLEAMACGVPVVVSNRSSLPEVVGDAGLSADPCSVEDIAQALHNLMTNDELHARLAAEGAIRARSFSWTQTAAMTVDAYRRALEETVK